MTAICYSFDPETRIYIGEVEAAKSPLETEVYLWPAFTTPTPPPALQANEAAVFIRDAWKVVPDHRGETWYRGETPAVIMTIGAVPDGLTPLPEIAPETVRAALHASLQALDTEARRNLISPGAARLLQARAARGAAKVAADAKGKMVDRRTEADKAAISDLLALTDQLATIELHFAKQEAALDAASDADLAAFRPVPFTA